MIFGQVTTKLEAIAILFIEDCNGNQHPIDFIVDTGFTGEMSLPSAVIASIGLRWTNSSMLVLGNGVPVNSDVYAATIVWDSQSRSVIVNAVETTPLIGMRLLAGYEVRIRVVVGGSVWMDRIP